MNDKEFLVSYTQSFKTIFSYESPEIVYIKDVDFKYKYMTKEMMKLIGIESEQQFLDKTSIETGVLTDSAKILEQWSEQNQEIKANLKSKRYLEVAATNNGTKIFVVHKFPIINPETKNFVGLRGQINNLIMPNIIKALFKMHGAKGLLIDSKINRNLDPLKEYPLTEIQHAVLYLALNNYSYSLIASLLNELGQNTTSVRVNDYLEQLKFIFHVRSKTALIEKAIGLNYHSYLPEILFNKVCSLELDSEEAQIFSAEQQRNI